MVPYISVASHVVDKLDIRSKTILHCCITWYCRDEHRSRKLLNILQHKAGFSLRTVDWMVTNYCKRHSIVTSSGDNTTINVHNDYERHLSVYNKRNYDPFARREKFKFTILGHDVTSTVGQLNFFKWFIERNLDELVREYQDVIEQDMKQGGKQSIVTPSLSTTVLRGSFDVSFL